jgi:indoleamine 2,3-dioxygenase
VKPLGVQYLGTVDEQEHRTDFGISAAQSSLFQAFDIIFGISHSGSPGDYLQEIGSHMPENHRRFLEKLTTYASKVLLRFVKADPSVAGDYDVCLKYIEKFRRGHISLAKRYAVVESSRPNKVPFGLAETSDLGGGARGAGGTTVLPFLNHIIEGTKGARAFKAV